MEPCIFQAHIPTVKVKISTHAYFKAWLEFEIRFPGGCGIAGVHDYFELRYYPAACLRVIVVAIFSSKSVVND
jgi:hypothetical protein